MNEAIKNYEAGNFEKASKDFSALNKEERKVSFEFYEALYFLNVNKTAEAKTLFKSILKTKDHLFVEQSQWYLALINIQSEEWIFAEKLLASITSSHYKYSDAQKLLKKLNKKSHSLLNGF